MTRLSWIVLSSFCFVFVIDMTSSRTIPSELQNRHKRQLPPGVLDVLSNTPLPPAAPAASTQQPQEHEPVETEETEPVELDIEVNN